MILTTVYAFGSDQTGTIRISDQVAPPGQEIIVQVEVPDGMNNVGAISIDIEYDSSVLTFKGFTDQYFSSMDAFSRDEAGKSFVGIVWSETAVGDGQDINDNATLINLVFDYHSGSSDLKFGNLEISEVDGDELLPIEIFTVNGSIQPDPEISALAQLEEIDEAQPGEEAKATLSVDFSYVPEGVSQFTFVIDFDEDVLTYKNVDNVDNHFGQNIEIEELSASSIKIHWYDLEADEGTDFSGDLLDIVFNFKQGRTDLTFNRSLSSMGDGESLDVNVNYTDGFMHQDASTIVQVAAGTVSDADPDSEVSVPVSIKNFGGITENNLGAFDFHIHINPDIIIFEEITINHPDIKSTDLSTEVINNGGTLVINWYEVNGIDLSENEEVFDIRFSFSSGLTELIFDVDNCEISDVNSESVFTEYENGLISEEEPYPVSVIIAEIQEQPGQITVPVTVDGFNDIGAFSFFIEYDSSVLTFEKLTNIIAGIDDDNLLVESDNQRISILWNIEGAAIEGLTVEGDKKLFDLEFQFKGGESDLTFDLAESSVSDYEVETLAANFIDGNVKSGLNAEIKVFLQGFYAGGGLMNKVKDFNPATGVAFEKFEGNVVDLITIELHEHDDYGNPLLVFENIELLTDGTANFDVPAEHIGEYYITITHRNHLKTVSAFPVSFTSYEVSYDFTDSAERAYGSNMSALEGGFYGLFAGDTTGDGEVTATDVENIIIAYRTFKTGYIPEIITGEGEVTAIDVERIIIAYRAFIEAKTP